MRQSSYTRGTELIIKQFKTVIKTIDKSNQGKTIDHRPKPKTKTK